MIEGFCWPLSAAPGETIAFRDGEPLPVAVWQVLNSQLVTELADNVTFQAHRGLLQSRLLSSEDLQIRHHGVCSLVCHRLSGVGCSYRQDLTLDHAGEVASASEGVLTGICRMPRSVGRRRRVLVDRVRSSRLTYGSTWR
jgi:hypothetical protein